MRYSASLSDKTKKVLHVIFLLFLLFLLRIWQLAYVERDIYEARKLVPQRRWVIEKPTRGTIHDRVGRSLAINRITYNAAIYYNNLQAIPRVRWKLDPSGNKVKVYERRLYIENLSKLLGRELELDPQYVEDLIHAKASLFPNSAFVLKKNISEECYYRLKMLERNWPALHAEISSERYYPQGKVGCDLLGHVGAIAQNEYMKVSHEIGLLKSYFEKQKEIPTIALPEGFSSEKELLVRLKELTEKAYTIHDSVGKAGVEATAEELLRGAVGHKSYEVDVQGNFLREIEGTKPSTPGKRVNLTISLELQKYAEELLAEDELRRDGRSTYYAKEGKVTQKQPWIKGGAIVLLDPTTSEVITLASYPRFNPNDFISSTESSIRKKKNEQIHKWYETEREIASIWEGKKVLERERFSKGRGYYTEKFSLFWDEYLKLIMPMDSFAHNHIPKTVKAAIQLQEEVEYLLYQSGDKNLCSLLTQLSALPNEELPADFLPIKSKWPFLFDRSRSSLEKAFLIDLARIAVFSPAFSDSLIERIGGLSISHYFSLCQELHRLEQRAFDVTKELFHEITFKAWRKEHMQNYLKEERRKEKERGLYARPYTDYLYKKENELFEIFWQKNRIQLLCSYILGEKCALPKSSELSPYYTFFLLQHQKDRLSSDTINLQNYGSALSQEELHDFIKTVRSYHELNRPLYCQQTRLRAKKGYQLEKHLAASFYPLEGYGFARSYAYRQSTPLGSIFKVVVALAALEKHYQESSQKIHGLLNPFEMVDQTKWDSSIGKKGSIVVGYTLQGKPYPRFYKGGRLPKSHSNHIGKINIIKALERSSNPYFSLLAGEYLSSPDELLSVCKDLGFGEKTGIELTGEIRGNLPNDLHRNKTGLYAFAIGQHSLIATPLQTANMLGSLANFGHRNKPHIIKKVQGSTKRASLFLQPPSNYPFQEELSLLGIDFPLFTSQVEDNAFLSREQEPEVVKTYPLPPAIRDTLFHGMHRVVTGKHGSARAEVIKGLKEDPALLERYKKEGYGFIGKTSTTEIMHNPYVYPLSKAEVYKHIWFGGISFKDNKGKESWNDPELVVVVFLKFGDAGKEAASIAYKMVEKYRELKKANKL